mmetsp:Transcript_122698/g.244079  ORF Transcript_122698/g.244079 Transcript_122698/m.244079 type:complete len:197 (+) Transcript_122698:55-645(+)
MAQELLHHAAVHGEMEQAALLLDRGGADPGAPVPGTNTTSLHAACEAGHLGIAKLLLDCRADANMCETQRCGGRTPLHIAAERDFVYVVLALVQASANPSIPDSRGHTALHLAAQRGRLEITQALVAQGADPHARDHAGFNAAWWAREFNHPDVVNFYRQIHVEPQRISAAQRLRHAGVATLTPRPTTTPRSECKR